MEEKRIQLAEEDVGGGFDLDDFANKYKWQISLVLLGLILLGVGVLGMNFWSNKEEGIEIISSEETETGDIFVDIQGAVLNPGIYQLPAGSRVNDLLIKAGGLSGEADREWIAQSLNLAQKLDDGAKIYIPKKGEAQLCQGYAGQVGQVSGSSITAKINLNTASVDELQTLPGIGLVYAQRIIENRPYKIIDDLLEVPGIGPKKFEKIKEKITTY